MYRPGRQFIGSPDLVPASPARHVCCTGNGVLMIPT